MKYIAEFGIDGGVSQGYGLKSPNYCKKEETFELEDKLSNDYNALCYAVILGYNLSRNHLSNPNTNETKVTLLNLSNEKKEPISQKEFVSKHNGVRYTTGNEINFSKENEKMVFTCSALEHILMLTN